ncbi:MAG: M20/M25/M40 family metallo-hydrolase, partial [Actinobacteria bacterium]|nr:M20/M25/M40 family metallo-hydrolase [Actinomycetota bacterium]
ACRIPSVSSEAGPAMREMADWLVARLGGLLDEVDLYEAPQGAPVVIGTMAGESPSTLLLYSHYDVQPAGPAAAWSVDPFAAEVRGDRMIARGACDDKADVMARIHALEAWTRTRGRPPVTVRWLCDGDEEDGSVALRHLVENAPDLIRADACLWESYLRRADGRPQVGFGARGLLHVELSVCLLARDQHSSLASLYRSAPALLVAALDTLHDADGRVAIDAFHDDVIAPEAAALALVDDLEPPAGSAVAIPGVDPFLTAVPGERMRRLIYEPTANISAIWSGHSPDQPVTVLPAAAHATVDFRLSPGQTPAAACARLRGHLAARGFDEVEVRVLGEFLPSHSPVDTPLAGAVVDAAADTLGEPEVWPIVPPSGPLHLITDGLGVEQVTPAGCTRPDSAIHGPDEQVRLDDYFDVVRFNVRLFELLEERGGVL